MFGHEKAQDVVKEMLTTLEELAIFHRLLLSLGMDGPYVKKATVEKLNQVKREKGY